MINFDAPEDRDTYVHRTGRTGRAGASGIAASFVLPDQHSEMRKIAADLGLQREYDANRGNAGDGVRQHSNGNGNGQRRANGNGNGQRQCQRQRPSALRREQAAPQAPPTLPVAHPSRAEN